VIGLKTVIDVDGCGADRTTIHPPIMQGDPMARSKNKQKRKSIKFKLKRTKRAERKKRLLKSSQGIRK